MTTNNHILGDRIYLRPLIRADATEAYVGWLNDPETTKFMESGRRKETTDSIAEYIARFEHREDARFLAIILKDTGRHIGNIKLEPIDWTHASAILGIMIGDPSARGKGLGFEAIITVLRFAFDDLLLHRVALGVTSDNISAIRCYEKAGFTTEGIMRESIRRDGVFIDSMLMGILDRDFRARFR